MRKGLFAIIALACCTLLPAQKALNNDEVIKLVKAGLSDDLIVSTIYANPGTYNTSADGLIALKSSGASDKVISAIVLKASGSTPAATTAAPAATAQGLPPGIDEVGVYYKNKSGAWTSLMPEIVNFKTGGVMKSILSEGFVKGDINGHVQGAHAKLSVTFPVTLAVYEPEGTDVTEYQLLRLRESGKDREFRSMTGGVFHASGGAKRDTLDFHPQKIAPRVYQITLDTSLGKGEYGMLPPGSYSSSNMASGGKIYAISITE